VGVSNLFLTTMCLLLGILWACVRPSTVCVSKIVGFIVKIIDTIIFLHVKLVDFKGLQIDIEH